MPITARARSLGAILDLPPAVDALRLHRPEVEAQAEAGAAALFAEQVRLVVREIEYQI